MMKQNAKSLMIDDGDYSTPQDHYFGFINKRLNMTEQERKDTELRVFDKLQGKSLTNDVILASVPDSKTLLEDEHIFFSSQTGIPKHEKKEYKNMSDMEIKSIFNLASVQNKKQEYKKDVRS